MTFAEVISKAFEQAVNQDAETFKNVLDNTTKSSCSSRSRDEIKQNKVHLVPKDWMDSLETYLDTKLDSKKPSAVENKSLLRSHDAKSKKMLVPSSVVSSSPTATAAAANSTIQSTSASTSPANAQPPPVKKLSYSAVLTSDATTSTTTTSSSDSNASDTSMGVIIGNTSSTPTSPTSSDATNSSFVVVQSNAQSFVRDETTTQTTTATTNTVHSSSTISSEEEEKVDVEDSDVNMDERTKRRMKWTKTKEKAQSSSGGSNSGSNSDTSASKITTKKTNVSNGKNILKDDLKHDVDYCIVGDNTWMLLSMKFGFDVDIESSLYFNDKVANTRFGGWGRLSVTGLKVQRSDCSNNFSQSQNEDVMIPESGLFNYMDALLKAAKNEGKSDDVNDLADEDLYDDDKTSPMLLLPPSTTSYASAARTNDPLSSSSNVQNNTCTIACNGTRKRKRYGCGLGNLGNTCFMNSTLQCLAHTSPLRSYFLSGEFANDLNRDNPLGTGGELAQEFASLLAEMWCTKQDDGNNSSSMTNLYSSSSRNGGGYRRSWNSTGSHDVVYPRNFKYTLGKHAEQFMGYNQHDSQELATYLLDALHEDTNRVSKKPYIEKPEQGENESDHDAATRAWDLHLKREDSRVMENFMGQVKSRVECPVEGCGRVSTTFDPFMYLSVPLPGAQDRTIEILFVPIHLGEDCIRKIKVTVSKTATCGELKKKFLAILSEQLHSSSDQIMADENVVLAEIFNKEIYTFYKADDEIEKIRDSDVVVAYEVTPIEVIHEEIKKAEKENPPAPKESSLENLLGDRPYGRLRLDLKVSTELNLRDNWEIKLGTYTMQKTLIPTLLNPRRMKSEKEKFYKNLCNFINLCYTSAEVSSALRDSHKSDTSDLELDSCGENDSDDGKMSPTSTVASRLGATAVDDESDVQTLAEICESSEVFKKVTTPEDVATLEFLARKFRQFLKNTKVVKKANFANGSEVQIVLTKKSRLQSYKAQASAKPIVIRIAPTTTVFKLREIIAHRLSHALRSNVVDGERNERTQPEEETNGDQMDFESEYKDPLHLQCTDAMNIIRQTPLTYEKIRYGAYTNSFSTTYGSNGHRKLGSIAKPEDMVPNAAKVRFAMPDDEDEKELVLDLIGKNGKIEVNFVTSAVENAFDESRWMAVEVPPSPTPQGNNDKTKSISVLDCISKYCQIEQLEESEMWYCNRCKDHVRAWKQFHLYRTPPILIIHLKRFQYSALSHRRDKIDSHIDFPLEGLDLRSEVMFAKGGQEPIYDCYAVSNHFGGLGGGHYTAYAVNDDGEWCNFDDSRVTRNVDKAEVVSKAAYVLYYKRRDVKTDDESWVNRALPSLCSRESSPVTTDMDIETDNDAYSMDDNNNDDEYGIKNFESIMP